MIRLKEAFSRAKSLGFVKTKSALAREIWPNSSPKSARMNYINLESGKTHKIEAEILIALCERLDVSVEYLLGMSEAYNEARDYRQDVESKINDIKELINNF